MATISLSGLHIYPIKSAAGIALDAATVQARGLQYDRRWMIVDRKQRFMTQRKFPRMALIQVAVSDDGLVVSAPGIEPLAVPLSLPPSTATDDRLTVEVWGDRCEAVAIGADSQAWMSEVLGTDCQLVYMPDDSLRPTDHGKFGDTTPVSFADAYPFLLISEASLADLNQRLAEPIPMNRFRPNLVVSGCEAFAEDTWRQVQIGSLPFTVAKACSRCTVPTVDQATGVRGKEPITTLATYRRWDGQIWFGQNLFQTGVEERQPTPQSDTQTTESHAKTTESQGVLRVGDRLTVLS